MAELRTASTLVLLLLPFAAAYLTMNGTEMQCGTYEKVKPFVEVRGNQLFVHGERFISKCVAYEAKPLGLCRREDMADLCPMKDETQEGTHLGYCYGGERANLHFAPEIGGNCWDSDMITAENFGRWQRDLDIMAEMGVNTVRIYHTNSQTCTSNMNPEGQSFASDHPGLRDHIPFLNYAASKGIYVIFPLYVPETSVIQKGEGPARLDGKGLPQENFKIIKMQLDEVDGHPAILMYTVGNELIRVASTLSDQKVVDYINKVIKFVRQHSKKPTTHADSLAYYKLINLITMSLLTRSALVDYPKFYNDLVKTLDVDVFATNVYRGSDLTDLWDQMRQANLTKPLLIAELGAQPIQSQNGQVSHDWPKTQWADIMKHAVNGGPSMGACYFQFLHVEDKSDGRYGMYELINMRPGGAFWDGIRPTRHDDPNNQADKGSATGAPLDKPISEYYKEIFGMSVPELLDWGSRLAAGSPSASAPWPQATAQQEEWSDEEAETVQQQRQQRFGEEEAEEERVLPRAPQPPAAVIGGGSSTPSAPRRPGPGQGPRVRQAQAGSEEQATAAEVAEAVDVWEGEQEEQTQTESLDSSPDSPDAVADVTDAADEEVPATPEQQQQEEEQPAAGPHEEHDAHSPHSPPAAGPAASRDTEAAAPSAAAGVSVSVCAALITALGAAIRLSEMK